MGTSSPSLGPRCRGTAKTSTRTRAARARELYVKFAAASLRLAVALIYDEERTSGQRKRQHHQRRRMQGVTMGSRTAARGGVPRPRRTSRSGSGALRAPGGGSGGAIPGRAEGYSWWGADGRAAAAATRRQGRGRASRAPARMPTGNRELVRRALSPPATRGRGAGALRRRSFRPAPSRLRNVSSSSSSSPASPRSS
ncbi:hypothetical protein GUJ93_ZPchr0013g34241 [Zizania palustris]|uniref:Uncharacterized protein n=1 Tax=Zizania palustris TaxID=103762 RepID=A0A8J5X156_ZIZPA|nr:hypothetical protein GUJ93_ZPchr0013g34241 [Zizania palustris]